MPKNDAPSKSPGHRLWRKNDRAKVSIFQTFRDAHAARIAERDAAAGGSDPAISGLAQARRDGVDANTLRAHIEADLQALLNTIHLGSTIDLSETPHVRASIVNYGFQCLSSVSLGDITTARMRHSIRQSLIDHEPRLIPETIDVTVSEADPEATTGQSIAISVSAELTGDPVDLALDFDAEIDMSAGKLKMNSLRVQS